MGVVLLHVAKRLQETDYKNASIVELVDVLRAGFEAARDMMIEEGEGAMFQVPRVGVFKVVMYKERICRNPQDQSMIRVPPRLKVKFKPSPIFDNKLNAKKRR